MLERGAGEAGRCWGGREVQSDIVRLQGARKGARGQRGAVRYREVAGCQKGVLRQGGPVRYREVAGCQKEVLGRQGGAVRYREVALGCSVTEKGAAEAGR